MFEIFISYRRSESGGVAGRLFDRLGAHFGDKHVFMDIDDLGPGENFALGLQKALQRCGAFIVLMGPTWAETRDEYGARRLDDPNDFVRMEVRAALEKGTRVLPVLIDGAEMPKASALPPELTGLLRYQAHEVRHDRFHDDVDRLIGVIDDSVGFGWHSLALSGPLRQLVLVVVGVAVATVVYVGATSFVADRRVGRQVRAHLEAGDRFYADAQYDEARRAYQAAIAVDPTRAPAMRRLVSSMTRQLLTAQFGYPSGFDIGLPESYFRRFITSQVTDSSVTEALGAIYRLRSVDRRLEDDVGLLLDEARVLKSAPWRVDEAVPVLERAREAAPDDPEVLAELGLVRAAVLEDRDGIELIRRAQEIDPDNPRYPFYLARSLQRGHECTELPGASYTYQGPVPGAAEACAAAVRAFRQARDLPTVDDPLTGRIDAQATSTLVDIFAAYAWRRFENPADTLGLSAEERAEAMAELVALPDRREPWQWPEIWQVVLHHAAGEHERARDAMRGVVADWRERERVDDDEPYDRMPRSWLALYAGILRAGGLDPDTLRRLEASFERRFGEGG